jgi:hypothetical protein
MKGRLWEYIFRIVKAISKIHILMKDDRAEAEGLVCEGLGLSQELDE